MTARKPISTDRQVAAFAPPEGQDKARCAVTNKAAGGLSLYVRADRQARAWVYRYRLGGKSIEMTLGRYPGMKLAEAREAHAAAAKLVGEGIDPRKHREAEKARNEAAWTMGEAFERWAAFYREAPTKGGHPPTPRTVAQHRSR